MWSLLITFVAGWVYTNLIEYGWHRWVLHSGHHEVHNAHHRSFFLGGYEEAGLLNRWAIVTAAAHVTLLSLFSLRLGMALALSVASYLSLLETLHRWQHGHPESRLARWHIEHHRYPLTHFNVFLPIWDYLLGPRRLHAAPGRLVAPR